MLLWARATNDVTCSGSSISCMSSLYELRVVWMHVPTNSGDNDVKMQLMNERYLMTRTKSKRLRSTLGEFGQGYIFLLGCNSCSVQNRHFSEDIGFRFFTSPRETDQGFGVPLGPERGQKSDPKSGFRIGQKHVFLQPSDKQGASF